MPETQTKTPHPEKAARELLTVQEKLNPLVFDGNGVMHEALRQQLLEKSFFLFDWVTKGIPGLEISDVRLVGSMTSYFYRQNSDIDVKVIVKNADNAFLPKEGRYLGEVLNLLHTSLLKDKIKCYINNKFVDIQFDYFCLDAAMYSILENKWITKPDKDRFKGITPEDLLANFYETMDEINNYMWQFQMVDGKYSIEDCKKMMEFYRYQVVDKTLDKRNKMNYLVLKMLSSQRIIKKLGAYAIECFNVSLSEIKNDEKEE